MKEIRIHGCGGQGSVTAAELLAVAAFEYGKYCHEFLDFEDNHGQETYVNGKDMKNKIFVNVAGYYD